MEKIRKLVLCFTIFRNFGFLVYSISSSSSIFPDVTRATKQVVISTVRFLISSVLLEVASLSPISPLNKVICVVVDNQLANHSASLRKQATFCDATNGFPAKCLRKELRNSKLMTRHYPDLGSASDWLEQISQGTRPVRSSTPIWVVMRHQCGMSALSQASFRRESDVAKCRLVSQAITARALLLLICFDFSFFFLPSFLSFLVII